MTKKLIQILENKESVLKNYLKLVKDRLLANTKIILDKNN